ncbi:MAG: hypothetical protein FWC80_01365 [Firmicutes bacterium]|nr:hypothetical protein [Bacillota bacterium]
MTDIEFLDTVKAIVFRKIAYDAKQESTIPLILTASISGTESTSTILREVNDNDVSKDIR